MDVADWPQLLALRQAAGLQQHQLAQALLDHGWRADRPLPTPNPTEADRRLADRQVAALLRLDLTLVPIDELPPYLRDVRPLPVALFVRGNPSLLHRRPASAVVGARKAGPRGCSWAQATAAALAQDGHLIVSGGAMGVDRAAHEGALSVGAATVVYMGTAIDRIYPRFNQALFSQVLQHGGALISEHPPYATTYKGSHALRNRFIAAHGQQLIVVEAAIASGTMGAVQYARRLGRPVFVAPPEAGGERAGLDDIVAKGWAQVLGPV